MHYHVCPMCGYCPHCGRGGYWPDPYSRPYHRTSQRPLTHTHPTVYRIGGGSPTDAVTKLAGRHT